MDFNRYPPDVQVELDERAAIMEYDGGLTREEAEQRAIECCLTDQAADVD